MTKNHNDPTNEERFIRILAGNTAIPEEELKPLTKDEVRRNRAVAALLALFFDENTAKRVAAYFGLGEFGQMSGEERATKTLCVNFSHLSVIAACVFTPLIGKPEALAAIRGQQEAAQ